MIGKDEHLYEAIEKAVAEKKPVLTDGGERMRLIMIAPTKFLVENLYWIDEERNVYKPVLEALYNPKRYDIAGLYVAGNQALDGMSSGIVSMFTKENRYTTII